MILSLRPDAVTIRNVFDRLAELGDLFRPVLVGEQTVPKLR